MNEGDDIEGHWEYRVVDRSEHSVHEECYEIRRVFFDTENEVVAHFPVRMITDDLRMMDVKIGALTRAMEEPVLKAPPIKERNDD